MTATNYFGKNVSFPDNFILFVFNIVTKKLRHLEAPEWWLTPRPDVWVDNLTRFKIRRTYKEARLMYKHVLSWYFNILDMFICLCLKKILSAKMYKHICAREGVNHKFTSLYFFLKTFQVIIKNISSNNQNDNKK